MSFGRFSGLWECLGVEVAAVQESRNTATHLFSLTPALIALAAVGGSGGGGVYVAGLDCSTLLRTPTDPNFRSLISFSPAAMCVSLQPSLDS